ncbi:MAG: 6-carboxytetrahydropterin synthase [bacterium]|nr:6-carboxytetrahydropterin synthase [bacterium]
MRLTVSKRFEFAASHRYFLRELTPEQNRARFGDKARGEYGHGHNYVAHFIFEGAVDERSGMLINVATIKEEILPLLARRYDHKYLNADTSPFDRILPTPENIARQLLHDGRELFEGGSAKLTAVRLAESDCLAATAYADGRVERVLRTDFSAARRTCSPHLTDEENSELFGPAASRSGHGHHYYLHLTLAGDFDEKKGMLFDDAESAAVLKELHNEFDHKNLNDNVAALKGKPITTEYLAKHFGDRLAGRLPLRKVRLSENGKFFVEYNPGESNAWMGIRGEFTAAHRLHSQQLSSEANQELYGKCNNPAGHGHNYLVEALVEGKLDERTGTLYDLGWIENRLNEVLEYYNYRHLDLETEEFRGKPSTGENIIHAIWARLRQEFGPELSRVRLWETANNRFTLRK